MYGMEPYRYIVVYYRLLSASLQKIGINNNPPIRCLSPNRLLHSNTVKAFHHYDQIGLCSEIGTNGRCQSQRHPGYYRLSNLILVLRGWRCAAKLWRGRL